MISIIIPYIDEHDYLAEAISSAAGRLEVEKEIIVVCNAPHIPEGYNPIPEGNEDLLFIHEPQTGSAYARNAGLKQAKGEWVQFLDVDDLLHPDKIFHQIHHTTADVVVSPHTYLFLNGSKENSKWLPEDLWVGLLNSGLGSTSSMLWRREALVETGGWSTDYQSHQEYELLFRLASAGKRIEPNDHCETIVRQRKSGSITTQTKTTRVREGIRLREQMWNYLKSIGQESQERFDAFRQYQFRQLRGLFRQDKMEAMMLYEKYFTEAPFVPREIRVPGYGILYRIFGFKRTEEIIQRIISRNDANAQK